MIIVEMCCDNVRDWRNYYGRTRLGGRIRAVGLGQLLLDVGGVLVDVLLTGEVADRLHYLVGDDAAGPAGRVARQVAELHRLSALDLALWPAGELCPRGSS